jgi:hypothetical protein
MIPPHSLLSSNPVINDLALYYEKKKSAMNLDQIKNMPER